MGAIFRSERAPRRRAVYDQAVVLALHAVRSWLVSLALGVALVFGGLASGVLALADGGCEHAIDGDDEDTCPPFCGDCDDCPSCFRPLAEDTPPAIEVPALVVIGRVEHARTEERATTPPTLDGPLSVPRLRAFRASRS